MKRKELADEEVIRFLDSTRPLMFPELSPQKDSDAAIELLKRARRREKQDATK